MAKIEPEKYFNDCEQMVRPKLTKSTKDSYQKIKLEFSIIFASNASYMIEVKLFDDQLLDFISDIQRARRNQTINFNKFFTCNFYFQKEQELQIILNKKNVAMDFNITLGQIVGSPNCTYVYNFSEDEKESLVIKAEKLGKEDDLLDVRLSLKNEDDPNYFENNKFYYIISHNDKKIYKSGEITNEGNFEPIYIPTNLLQPHYQIKIFNLNNEKIYSLRSDIDNIKFERKLPRGIQLSNGVSLEFEDNSEIIKNYTLFDYIKSGVKIALSIGIDFTKSNKHPREEGSLHSIKGPNDYERAINACANIVGYYDYDQLFPVFGFGAKIKGSGSRKPSMCFNLNFRENADIKGVDEIIRTYHEIIEKEKLTFSGPTKFTPLIGEVISRIDKKDLFEYHILLILTDGVINDLKKTRDILVEASFLPLSVIIVGIGNADFTKMKILDGDEVPLTSSKGTVRARDLVQFVPFSKYENDEKKLAMEVLAEIPRQLVEYYKFKNLDPEKLNNLRKRKNVNIKSSNNINNNNNFNDINNNINSINNIHFNDNFDINNKIINNNLNSNNGNFNNFNGKNKIDNFNGINRINYNNHIFNGINSFNNNNFIGVSTIDNNKYNGIKSIDNNNNFNGINNIKKRNENFVDNNSYYSRPRHSSIDVTNSNSIINYNNSRRGPSNISIRPASNIINRVPSRVSSRPPSSRHIPPFLNDNIEQKKNIANKSISTQGNVRYNDENGSYKKKLESRNSFDLNPNIDIFNDNKKPNDMRRISIDNSSKNKNRLRENLNYYGYNVLVTSGNDIINKNKKIKDFYQNRYNNDEFDLDKLSIHETIMLKKIKKKK